MDEQDRDHLRQLWDKFNDEAPGELNPAVRKMLGKMTAEDAEVLRDAIRFYRTAGVIGKFLRWTMIVFFTAFGIFGGLAAFGDHAANIWKVFTGQK